MTTNKKISRPKRNYISTETREKTDPDLGVVTYRVSIAHFGEDSEEFAGESREDAAQAWLNGRKAEARKARRNYPVAKILAKLDKAEAVVKRIGRLTVNDVAIVGVKEYLELDAALSIFREWVGPEQE